MTHPTHTPFIINSLAENEIFVFGSNLRGAHGGGAASVALLKFGAILGQGVGLQGQSYAIPTMHGGVDVMRDVTYRINELYKYESRRKNN